jgi:hypothetical protein
MPPAMQLRALAQSTSNSDIPEPMLVHRHCLPDSTASKLVGAFSPGMRIDVTTRHRDRAWQSIDGRPVNRASLASIGPRRSIRHASAARRATKTPVRPSPFAL